MKKALFSEFKFSKDQEKVLLNAGVEVKYVGGDLNDRQIIKELQDCQIYIIGGSDRATETVINSTNLELIIFWGTGYESYIDLKASEVKKIKAANTPHANAYTVAEHTVALMLDAVKQITYLNNAVRVGKWIRRETWNLAGKTLGIIGMGAIGGNVARIMHKGFNIKVLYCNRSENKDLEVELGAEKVSLNTLLTDSDLVSIHTPLTPETKYIIGEKQFSLMKSHAVLINCTRADVIEPKALRESLKSGKIATAAFDTYYKEPAPKVSGDEWGLLSLPANKFILTSHTGYGSKEAVEVTNEMVVENIISYLKTGKPRYGVN
jgi:lactate dehydrogenase-like 2-hydroxyacid dehydrogenase